MKKINSKWVEFSLIETIKSSYYKINWTKSNLFKKKNCFNRIITFKLRNESNILENVKLNFETDQNVTNNLYLRISTMNLTVHTQMNPIIPNKAKTN